VKKFFEDNSKPTAWSAFTGNHVWFSVAREIYKRDEKEIKALVAQHKLKVIDNKGSYISFTKD
jgi:hypothetical protein